MDKVLYFRIGIDTGVGGCVGPIFSDHSFEYIPIPDLITTEQCTYKSSIGRKGLPFSYYVPRKLHDQQIHYDPDFRNKINVYGDSTSHQKYFKKLNKGDIVLFYAGLTPWLNGYRQGSIDLYIIGYLVVDKIHNVNINNIKKIKNNAHSKRYKYIEYLSSYIEGKHGLDYKELIEIYKNIGAFNLKLIIEGIKKYKKNKNNKYSNVRNFDKNLEKILNKENWNIFINNSTKEEAVETYTYLLDKFSKFILVCGDKNSKLLQKAIKISDRSLNKSGTTENVVSKKWSTILGIPEGLSLQRKNPRWIPNKKYQLEGNIDQLKKIIIENIQM